ncbi:MAG TPA: hypothetical protein VNN07_15005 [Candidatus Tectomicrobia bacterium]|nr:hypothetical protein [Candidatus Tectomicrobia bacterium]
MKRLLVIDPDRAARERLALACLAHDVAVTLTENLCDGVRALLGTPVSLVLADGGTLRLTPREHATLFERVAPGVPVAVSVRADAPLDTRVALELAGFDVVTSPVAVEDLLAKLAGGAPDAG